MENFGDVAKSAWVTDDGKEVFCVPMASVIHGFFYNKEAFDTLGLTEPTTEEEFKAVLDAIKKDGTYIPIGMGTADLWESATMGFQNIGPNYWKGEEGRKALIAGTAKFTDEPYVNTFKSLATWKDYMPAGFEAVKYADAQQLFTLGKAAIYPTGSWEIATFEKDAAFEMGIFKPPVAKAGDQCYISDHTDIAMGMNASTKNPEAAKTFLSWVASPEFATLYGNALPGFFPLTNAKVELTDPLAQEFLSWRGECKSTIRNSYAILSRGEPNLENELWRVSAAVINGTLTPEKAAEEIQAGLDKWYKPAAAGAATTQEQPAVNMDELVAAAKAEGELTVIALPHNWCNYGGAIEGFKAKYGLKVNELNPDAGSGDEIEAIKANKDNKGPQAPDVIDVGFGFGPQLIEEKLVQPYKVSTWNTIPDSVKDPNGYWYGDYYGVLAFEVNKDAVENVPQDWADLLKPEYEGQVALSGDPRVSAQAQMSVYAAALANGGSLDDVQPGLDYFKKLNDAGNFVPVVAKQATVASGETPVITRWDYNALADKDELAGNPEIEVVIPKTGVIAGVYIQAISAYAPHPNAAKLWMEYLYSDEGQLEWMKGYCHPIRFDDLNKKGIVPADLSAKLPPVNAVFPSIDQINKAKQVIADAWMSTVGADVK